MLSSLRPIIGLSSCYNNVINLYYFNNYYYARPIRRNYDIRHHFACYSAILNTSSELVKHSCQIIITLVVSPYDPSELTQHGKCVSNMMCVLIHMCVDLQFTTRSHMFTAPHVFHCVLIQHCYTHSYTCVSKQVMCCMW